MCEENLGRGARKTWKSISAVQTGLVIRQRYRLSRYHSAHYLKKREIDVVTNRRGGSICTYFRFGLRLRAVPDGVVCKGRYIARRAKSRFGVSPPWSIPFIHGCDRWRIGGFYTPFRHGCARTINQLRIHRFAKNSDDSPVVIVRPVLDGPPTVMLHNRPENRHR